MVWSARPSATARGGGLAMCVSVLVVLAGLVTAPATAHGATTQQAYPKASNTGATTVRLSVAFEATRCGGRPAEDSNATGVNPRRPAEGGELGGGEAREEGEAQGDNSAGAAAAPSMSSPAPAASWTQQAYLKASNTGVRRPVRRVGRRLGRHDT